MACAPCLQRYANPFLAAHVHDCWYGAITCLPSYMILSCFPGYHRSKAACYFVHCEFSGSVFNIDMVGYELNCRCNSQCHLWQFERKWIECLIMILFSHSRAPGTMLYSRVGSCRDSSRDYTGLEIL